MTSNSHNRQAHRTRTALKRAFVTLLSESSYETITIGNVADRADVGRSTFYRHYASKADLLLDWHEDIFRGLHLGLYAGTQWLVKEPPVQLTAFFERMHNSRMPLHNFGNDGAFVLRRIGVMLTQQIEDNLRQSFANTTMSVPLTIVARSIAGVYVWIFQWWIMEHPPYTAEQMATYTHHMIRSVITASVSSET